MKKRAGRVRRYFDWWMFARKIYLILFFLFASLTIVAEQFETWLLFKHLRPFSLHHHYTFRDYLPMIPSVIFIIILYVGFGAYLIAEYRERKVVAKSAM